MCVCVRVCARVLHALHAGRTRVAGVSTVACARDGALSRERGQRHAWRGAWRTLRGCGSEKAKARCAFVTCRRGRRANRRRLPYPQPEGQPALTEANNDWWGCLLCSPGAREAQGNKSLPDPPGPCKTCGLKLRKVHFRVFVRSHQRPGAESTFEDDSLMLAAVPGQALTCLAWMMVAFDLARASDASMAPALGADTPNAAPALSADTPSISQWHPLVS